MNLCCGEQGRFSLWSAGTAVLRSVDWKMRWVSPFTTREGPGGTVNLGLQRDGYNLHSECKHFTETEHNIKAMAELNLVVYIHLEKS